MNNRVNFNRRTSNRRSGRQNFSNCTGTPVEEEQFNNRRVSPRRNTRRSPTRRSGRQNFRNKRTGKERFTDNYTDNLIKFFEIMVIVIVVLTFIFIIYVILISPGKKIYTSRLDEKFDLLSNPNPFELLFSNPKKKLFPNSKKK